MRPRQKMEMFEIISRSPCCFLLSVGRTRLQILTCEVVSDTYESKRYLNGIIMVNFMFQFDWAMGYPTIWSNSILGVPVRVFRDEINI